MKLHLIKPAFILTFALSIFATGCLKDKAYDNGEIQSLRGGTVKPIEIKLTAGNSTNFLNIAVDNSNNDTTINLIPVNLASADAAPEDIKVTLTLNPTLVADYNVSDPSNIKDFVVPSPSMYTVLNAGNVVTIAKGTHTGYLQIKFKPSSFLIGSWAFGYAITSVDKAGYTISGNLGTGVVALGAKNKYDGKYELTGFHNRPGLDRPYDETVYMITTGPNSIKMFWPGAGDAHPIDAGTTYYGSLTTEFIFDATTNALAAVNNPYTPGSPPFTVGPATDSRYVPATKTIYAQYYYNGNLQRIFTDTLRYLGPRP